MEINLNMIRQHDNLKEVLFFHHPSNYILQRPVQAWQWMNQSKTVPDTLDWVREEVLQAWQRCLEEYALPLGKFANWDDYPVYFKENPTGSDKTDQIVNLLKQLNNNFHIFLQETGATLLVACSDGNLKFSLGETAYQESFIKKISQPSVAWAEQVLGNNGIGTAVKLKQPIAFQGMEHYLNALHPYTTIGYPLLDNDDQVMAVIGVVCDRNESVNSLFAFLHLICVLINSTLPLAKDELAQNRVLQKINTGVEKKPVQKLPESTISEHLSALLRKSVKLQTFKMPILVTGESGVGKDHFVRLMRDAGPRKEKPLIAINCASIPHDLIESELFGYEAGSFTGAKNKGKPGKFLLADKGILFLDEIGDMSFDLQATLLRVLETSEFTPVGGSKPVQVDVQLVAATNVDLLEAVHAGRFRRDLYYRLNGAQIHLLPLRERPEKKDIIRHIVKRELLKLAELESMLFDDEAMQFIEQHPWPGNIRQLINVVRATIFTASGNVITINDLPQDFMLEMQTLSAEIPKPVTPLLTEEGGNSSIQSLEDWELYGIKKALDKCQGNITLTAKMLGITRATLYKKIQRFGLKKANSEKLGSCTQ